MVALMVILMLAVVFIVDYMVRLWRARRNISVLPQPREVPLPEWAMLPLRYLQFPRGLFYGRGHTWASLQADGQVRIGIDDFVNAAIGPVDDVRTVRTGTRVRRGDRIAQLRQGNASVWIQSPVSGTVRRTNLDASPALIHRDPYDQGWLAEVEPDDAAADLPVLRVGRRIADWIEAEALRFGRWLAGNGAAPAMARLQDGGTPVDRRLDALGPDGVGEFSTRFLSYQEEN